VPLRDTAPDTRDYVLGRGVVSIALHDADGNPMGFRDLGNAPGMTITGTREQVEHISSRTSTAKVDKRVVTSQGLTAGFTLDEVQNLENLADWLIGETSTPVNGAVAGFAQWQIIADGDIEEEQDYLIRSSLGVRAYSIDETDVTLETTNLTPVTLVLGTDYTVDELTGTFRLLDSAAVNTAITNGEGIDITLAANAGAPATVDQVRALKATNLVVALRYVMENAADGGRKTEFLFPRVLLSSEGDMSLIGTDFATMQFQASVEQGDVGSVYEDEYLVITDPNGTGN
jgi:hypothetical protein